MDLAIVKINNCEVRRLTEHRCHLHLGVEGTARTDWRKIELVYVTKHVFVAGEERILFNSGDGLGVRGE